MKYLERLINTGGTVLIFIAPSKRFPTLWPELIRRCKQAGYPIELIETDITEIKKAQLNAEQYLVLFSWRVILDFNSARSHISR